MLRFFVRTCLPLLWLFTSCAGRLDPGDFLLPLPEVDPDAAPVHSVRTAHDPQTGELTARWVVLVFPDGRVTRDGREERFHSDGSLSARRDYVAGKPVGEWREWHSDGTPRLLYEFVPDEESLMSFFHPGGLASARGAAIEGIRQGEWSFWYPGGGLRQRGSYLGGVREGLWTLRWPNGGLRSRGSYAGDERVGEWRHWPEQPPVMESDWEPAAPVSSGR